jgi:hypothetical protein
MHDPEVTDVDPVPRRARRRAKRAFDASPFRSLFRLFRSLRAASVEALHWLWFSGAFPGQSTRTTGRMVEALLDEGFLARMPLTQGRGICHLTRRSLATFEQDGVAVPETLRRPPTVEIGGYLWLLSNIRAAHVRGGFNVGRGPREAHALRRFLLDAGSQTPRHVLDSVRAKHALSPLMVFGCECGFRADVGARVASCPRCKRATTPFPANAKYECAGCGMITSTSGPHRGCVRAMREVDALPCDIAWLNVGRRYEVRLLFVEQPTQALGAQLAKLPLMHVGAPKVPVVLRSTDPDSRYDRKRHEWAVKGPRHQQLERTFTESGFDEALPFSKTATLVDALHDLQLHILRSGAAAPAWQCAPAWNGGAKLAARNKQLHEQQGERLHDDKFGDERVRIADARDLKLELEEAAERAEPERVVRERPSGALRVEERSGGGMRRR